MNRKSRFVSLMLALVMCISVFPTTAMAAPDFIGPMFAGEQHIRIGSEGYDDLQGSMKPYTQKTLVNDPVKGATYSAGSSNDLVVTTKVVGYDVLLTGISQGTAIVTLYQTLNGKTKKVDTIDITVHLASHNASSSNFGHNYPIGSERSDVYVEYRNVNAVYTYVIDKEGLTIEDTIKTWSNGSKRYLTKMTATKSGTYKVAAYETLNGVTRYIKTITYNIHDMEVVPKVTIGLDSGDVANSITMNYANENYTYYFEIDGVDYLYVANTSWSNAFAAAWTDSAFCYAGGMFIPNRLGTEVVKVYRSDKYNADGSEVIFDPQDDSRVKPVNPVYLGSCEVTVIPGNFFNVYNQPIVK